MAKNRWDAHRSIVFSGVELHAWRNAIVWAFIVALMMTLIEFGFLASPETALNYWYLFTAPLLITALRFGLRGVVVISAISALLLSIAVWQAGESFSTGVGFLEQLLRASTSPREAQMLARELANVRAADPRVVFGRALLGLAAMIVSGALLGASTDARARAETVLKRPFHQLARYFSPQVVEAILDQIGEPGATFHSVRREITVLFADLRGFTTVSERLGPEDTARLLNEFFTAMTEEIFREGGTLDKYIGDAVMAFFGDPVWYDDHPERAFRAALAMQQRMKELQAQWVAQGRDPIGMGIGITTGYAVVGSIGSPSRMEYSAVGSTVNTAARLTDIAQAGQILASRKTYRRVQHLCGAAPRGSVMLKGFEQPIEIVEILGMRLAPSQAASSFDQRLLDLIAQIVNDSALRASLIANPGDSPLLFGLNQAERALAQQVAVLSGYPIFRGLPAAEIALLMHAGSVEALSEGEVVIRQGEMTDKFYVILQGDVVVTATNAMQREHHVASLARGEYFGEVALLFDVPRTATVRTGSPARLLVLHRDEFDSVLAQAPALRAKVEATARDRMEMLVTPSPGAERSQRLELAGLASRIDR